ADVFVHASLSETFGNVLGEALWCGRAAVAFDDGMGAASQILDGVNGRMIDPHAAGADRLFADAVLDLLDHPEKRARIGAAAAERQRLRSAPQSVLRGLGRAFADADARAARGQTELAAPWSAALTHAGRWGLAHGALLVAGYLRPGRQRQH